VRQDIYTPKGAAPAGPYSQAIVAEGRFVYISGQGPADPETGELVLSSFRAQAERVFRNLDILLEASGASWADVVKVGAFLADLGDFPVFNEVYKQFVVEPYPARTTVQAGLGQIAIEVDCIAVLPE
jgi:2-iminobutanoate/2-iminopropanoate deaminase